MSVETYVHFMTYVVTNDAALMTYIAVASFMLALGWRLTLIGLAARRHGKDFWDKPM